MKKELVLGAFSQYTFTKSVILLFHKTQPYQFKFHIKYYSQKIISTFDIKSCLVCFKFSCMNIENKSN